jgi:16S rRNA (guanine527-N7)-methyltransferase
MLPESTIARLLSPYLPDPPPALVSQLQTYLDLLLRWNARTNLTAIRDPDEIVRRHFGESLFCARHLAPLQPSTLLDFGSGAGFPGLPIQLLLPNLKVTLAESQGKKATFLREVIRTLNLPTELWPHRVETMPPDRQFDIVTLRAVDRMSTALAAARPRIAPGGYLVTFTAEPSGLPIPATQQSFLHIDPLAQNT